MKSILLALLIIFIPLVSFGTEITVTAKSAGDAFTAAELNQILGAIQLGTYNIKTASATINKATIEILRIGSTDVTATGTELNYVDVTTIGVAQGSKAVVLSSTKSIDSVTFTNLLTIPSNTILYVSGTGVTTSGAELNILDGATLDVNELNYLDIATPGVVYVTKAIVPSATGTIFDATIGTLTIPNTGGVVLPSGASFTLTGVAVTSSGTELNYLDGSYPGLTVASTAQVVSSTKYVAEVNTGSLTIPANGSASFATSALQINGNRIMYATSIVISTTTADVICVQVPTIDSDDWIFPALQYGSTGLEAGTYITGATPQAGAVQIRLASAPAAYGGNIRINIMALED